MPLISPLMPVPQLHSTTYTHYCIGNEIFRKDIRHNVLMLLIDVAYAVFFASHILHMLL